MKTQLSIFVILITITLSLGYAKENKSILNTTAIKNMQLCLKCENDGVKKSAIYYAGQYKVETTLIKLLEILHNDKDDETRMLAAKALSKIGGERAIYAIKGSAQTDISSKVRVFCSKLYISTKTQQQESLLSNNN